MALTLYYSPGSSSMATHIALNEVGARFELNLTALHRNEHRAADYLAVNPEGKVPTLMIDGRPLTEVAATLWYLARRYPDAGKTPTKISPVTGNLQILRTLILTALGRFNP